MTSVRVAVPCLLAIAVSAAAAVAPGGIACTVHEVSGTKPEAFDERPMLRHLADAVALPAMRSAKDEGAALAAAIASLDGEPTRESLVAAQDAWRAARAAWVRTAVFRFGPAKDLVSRIDWPADPAKVEALAAGEGPFDAASVSTLGASERGLGALEVLLFVSGDGDDAEVLAAFEGGPRRGAVARALADDVAAATAELAAAWEPSAGGFADELATAGEGSATYPTRKAGTDAVVNEAIFVLERVVGDGLALPLGLRSDGVPQPDAVTSPRADASIDDALALLDAVGAAYLGGWGAGGLPVDAEGGLSDLVVARGSGELDGDVRDALAHARASVAAIPPPLRRAVIDDPASVQRGYEAARELKRLLSSDVATAVGTTLGFDDNDGD
jgi:predicted lipoprotein